MIDFEATAQFDYGCKSEPYATLENSRVPGKVPAVEMHLFMYVYMTMPLLRDHIVKGLLN